MPTITWGTCRGDNDESLCTVFCLTCREIFLPRYITPAEAKELMEQAQQSHQCAQQRELL